MNNNSNIKSEIYSFTIVIAIAICIRLFIIELFYVPTGSMKTTILEGDYIFSTKYSYGYSNHSFPFAPNLFEGRMLAKTPKRGDIVITKSNHDLSTRFVKRLIGMPGEKIEIINDVIYINDKAIDRQKVGDIKTENGVKLIKFSEKLPNGITYNSYKIDYISPVLMHDNSNYGPVTVPNNHYFLMGDNRDDSGDSRYNMGPVPFNYLIAKAQFVLFSTKEPLFIDNIGIMDQLLRVWTWLTNFRMSRIFHKLYLDE